MKEKFNKKAMGAIVATSLLIVVTVILIVSFSGWFNNYTSSLFIESDKTSNIENTRIETLIGNEIYFFNGYGLNLTIISLKIGNNECDNIQNQLKSGMNNINIYSCLENISTATPEVVLITDKGMYSKQFYLSDVVIKRTMPNSFNFENLENVDFNTFVISNIVIPSGYDGPLNVNLIGDGNLKLRINGGEWITNTSMYPGDSLELGLTSSDESYTTKTVRLTLGDYSTQWSVTTKKIFLEHNKLESLNSDWENYYDINENLKIENDNLLIDLNWSLPFDYRRSFLLKHDYEINDYQIKINVKRSLGEDTNNIVYVSEKIKPDYSDIRFTNSKNELLNYWIEKSNSSEAIIWVKFDNIKTTNTHFYMYHGKQNANSLSNGHLTFDFFDNFEKDVLDNRWINDSNGSFLIDNTLRTNNGSIGLVNPLNFNLNDGYILEGKILYHLISTGYSGTLSAQSSRYTQGNNAGGDATSLYMRRNGISDISRWTGDGSTDSYNCGSGGFTDSLNDVWYILSAKFNSDGVIYEKDRFNLLEINCNWVKNLNYISLGAFNGLGNVQDTSYDWVLIRKYSQSELLWDWGIEENLKDEKLRVSLPLDIGSIKTYTNSSISWNSTEINFGNALEFKIRDKVNISNQIFPEMPEITISFWANPNDNIMDKRTSLFYALDFENVRTLMIHLPYFQTSYSSPIYWDAGNDGSSYDRIHKNVTLEELQGWTYWSFTKNATSGDMKIYRNGKLWHSEGGKTALIKPFNEIDLIRNYHGMIDEISIWDYALTQEEIQMNMYKQLNGNEEGLIGYWNFNEGEGNVVYDLTENENHGDLIGAKWTEGIQTKIEIETAITYDETLPLVWQKAIKNQPISQLNINDDLTGKYLWLRQKFFTNYGSITPILHNINLTVSGYDK